MFKNNAIQKFSVNNTFYGETQTSTQRIMETEQLEEGVKEVIPGQNRWPFWLQVKKKFLPCVVKWRFNYKTCPNMIKIYLNRYFTFINVGYEFPKYLMFSPDSWDNIKCHETFSNAYIILDIIRSQDLTFKLNVELFELLSDTEI